VSLDGPTQTQVLLPCSPSLVALLLQRQPSGQVMGGGELAVVLTQNRLRSCDKY
jgi:hypothetical protein